VEYARLSRPLQLHSDKVSWQSHLRLSWNAHEKTKSGAQVPRVQGRRVEPAESVMRSSPMLTSTSRGMQPYWIYLHFLSEGRTLVLFSQVRNESLAMMTETKQP